MRETSKPKRIQRKRVKGWRMPENAVYVGRPTKWGNPIELPPNSSPGKRRAVVDAYRQITETGEIRTHQHLSKTTPALKEYQMFVQENIEQLRGKDLACWCKLCDKHQNGKPFDEHCPDCDPCHCDPLGVLANDNH